jgi:hypothetical protein
MSKRQHVELKKQVNEKFVKSIMTPDYYYQVQGQLFVTAAPFCEFIVYTKLDIAVDLTQTSR